MNDQDIDLYFRFLGYGEIKEADVWFIGAEPGGLPSEFKRDQEHVQVGDEDLMYDPGIPEVEPGKSESGSWSRPRQIMAALGHGGTSYFLGNMAPLPRSCMAKSHEGISAGVYVAKVRNEYVPRLLGARQQFNPKAVVFHGVSAVRMYGIAQALGIAGMAATQTMKNIQVFEDQRVILTGHFSWSPHFGHAHREFVISKLQAWLS